MESGSGNQVKESKEKGADLKDRRRHRNRVLTQWDKLNIIKVITS